MKATNEKAILKNALCILPITSDGRFVMVNTCAPRAILVNEENASTPDLIKHYLLESTAYQPDRISYLDKTALHPELPDCTTSNYIAWGCHISPQAQTSTVNISTSPVVLMTPKQALEAAMSGEIEDVSTSRMIFKFFQMTNPVTAEILEDKSSAFMMGLVSGKNKSEHYNPFRNLSDHSPEFLDWDAGRQCAKIAQTLVS